MDQTLQNFQSRKFSRNSVGFYPCFLFKYFVEFQEKYQVKTTRRNTDNMFKAIHEGIHGRTSAAVSLRTLGAIPEGISEEVD